MWALNFKESAGKMKISKFKINNFRPIENTAIECTDFNIYVGQNNAGKTNFFEAVDWFFNGTPKSKSISDLHFRRDTNKEIIVKLSFQELFMALRI